MGTHYVGVVRDVDHNNIIGKMAVRSDVVEDWRKYFTYLTSFLNEGKRNWDTTDKTKVSYFCERLECLIRSTQRLLSVVRVALLNPDECDPGISLRECRKFGHFPGEVGVVSEGSLVTVLAEP